CAPWPCDWTPEGDGIRGWHRRYHIAGFARVPLPEAGSDPETGVLPSGCRLRPAKTPHPKACCPHGKSRRGEGYFLHKRHRKREGCFGALPAPLRNPESPAAWTLPENRRNTGSRGGGKNPYTA